MSRKIFTAFGNCQANALALVLQDYPAFTAEYSLHPLPMVMSTSPTDLPQIYETLRRCDLLIYQPVLKTHPNIRLASQEVLAACPPHATRFVINPNFLFFGYMPQVVTHEPLPHIWGIEHDTTIVYGYLHDLAPATLVAVMQDEALYPAEYSRAWLRQTLDQVARQEDFHGVDFKVSDFLAAQLASQRVFHSTAHPARAVFDDLAHQLLLRLGLSPVPRPAPAYLEPLTAPRLPIYRSTYLGLGLTFAEAFDHSVTGMGLLTLEETIANFYDFYAQQDRTVLETLLRRHRADSLPHLTARLPKHLPQPRLAAPASLPSVPAPTSPMPRIRALSPLPLAPDQVDLLLAALSPDPTIVAQAWERWQPTHPLAALPADQRRLLGRLYANLQTHQLPADEQPALQEFAWRTWSQMQHALPIYNAVWGQATAENVLLAITGEMAVALGWYPTSVERDMEQYQFMLPPQGVARLAHRLTALGWRCATPLRALANPTYLRWAHSVTFHHPTLPIPVTLQWRLLPEGPRPGRIQRINHLIRPTTPTPHWPLPSPELLLVQAAATAFTGGRNRLIALVDVAMLWQRAPLNWDAVVELADLMQAARATAYALRTLAAVLDCPPPSPHIHHLHEICGNEYAPAQMDGTLRPGLTGWRNRARFHYRRWRRLANLYYPPRSWHTFPLYLMAVTGAPSLRQLPVRLLRTLYTRLVKPNRPTTGDPQ